ncbi:MCT family MFS transporter [Kluyveromyces lactis]|uniref:KLLA0C17336p n=1 Tax=Kluyveromyces lactis (strain ATCC 8585 / CBS 2359 / DSM 70799 / NBRC 1267 / NRRL Y-1140 / WM37) TaxID=284590 RepID=Q6CSW4_KLULA|nr:uncharacterized protein KLLA0_C17336g [Kluyveromyces lactis]CAH01826.1 KLLA0C17336p [Kluyveromyces lactis]|eukprot:XP_452975.1 uncharacterized protein KLLA0_C17336g [Kluyveromyces lactis]
MVEKDLEVSDQKSREKDAAFYQEEAMVNETEKYNESVDYNKIQIPDGGYGWVVCMCYFFLNFCTWGSNSGFAIYLSYYLESNRFPGATKLDFAAIGGLAFGAGLIFAPLINYFVIKTSVKTSIAVGIVLQGAALLLCAFATKLWQVFLTQGLLVSFGLAFISIPATNIISPWFRRKRTLALGIGASGSGLGGILFNLAMQRIVEVKSLKWALISQCIINSVLSTVALLLIRTRDNVVRETAKEMPKFFELSLLKNAAVWFLIFYVSCTMLGYVVLLYSLSAFAVSLGYSQKQGSIVSCMISVGGFVFRPAVGHVADKYGPVTVGIIVHAIVGIICLAMWIPCRNLATAIAFGLLSGALMGSIWPLQTSIISRIGGLNKLPAIYSFTWPCIGMMSIVSPIIGLRLRSNDPTVANQYVNTAIFSGMGYFGAAFFLWMIRGYLIARDKLAMVAKTGHDDGELHLHVTIPELLKGLLTIGRLPRKV